MIFIFRNPKGTKMECSTPDQTHRPLCPVTQFAQNDLQQYTHRFTEK
jgi:hypothetical protein